MLRRLKFKSAFLKRSEKSSAEGITADRFKTKNAPSHYPLILFRLLQVLELVSALAVTVIMFWFVYHLRNSSIAVPWKFISLLIVSILTVIALTANVFISFSNSPSSTHNAILNGTLLLLWTAAFTTLAAAMRWTLQRSCNLSDWDTSTGMAVCSVYKALFSFALAEIPLTFLALCLDLVVRRQETYSGTYARTEEEQQPSGARHHHDPYSESSRLTDLAPSPGLLLLSPGYGGSGEEKGELVDDGHVEVESLRDRGPRGLGAVYRVPEMGERRYDDGGEDIGYHRAGRRGMQCISSP